MNRKGCVITNYHYDNLVLGAIHSAFGAGFDVVVCVDNGGKMLPIYERLIPDMDNFHVILNKDNVGISTARNQGIALLKSFGITHFSWLDADDFLLPSQWEASDYITYGGALIWHTDINFIQMWSAELYEKSKLLDHNYIPSCSALIPMKVYDEIGGLDPNCDGAEDWDYWIRAEMAGFKFERINTFRYVRREHGANAESRITQKAIDIVKNKHKL